MPSVYYFSKEQIRPRSYQIYKKITILGNESDDDIIVNEPFLTQSKLNIIFTKKGFTIEHVGKSIEFYVNGKKKKRSVLQDNDIVRVGSTFIIFSDKDIAGKPEFSSNTNAGRDFKKLSRISMKIMEESNVIKLLNALLDSMIEILDADKGFIIMVESGTPDVKVARNISGNDIPTGEAVFSDSILNRVLSGGKPIIVSDALSDSRFSSSTSIMSLKLCSVIAAPLKYKGTTLGCLYLGNDNIVSLFTNNDLELLTIFTSQASAVVHNALLMNELESKVENITKHIENLRFGAVIGSCEGMKRVYKRIEKVAPTDVNVLILGETGTGKELIAHEIHNHSNRSKGPFIAINCGAIPENLLESELFGHVRGAFTGAVTTKEGKFQAARRGTLFLDEIGELPLNLQVKLLRAIQEKQVLKVGGLKPENVDIRIVAASNRNLAEEVEKKNFREDLFYRLNVISMFLPPLRDRGDDIILVANYLLRKYNIEFSTNVKGFSPETIELMKRYSWPGNIRELENKLKKAIIFAETPLITPEFFEINEIDSLKIKPLSKMKEDFQMSYILKVLEMNNGNRTKTARDLDIDPRTVFRYLEKEKENGSPSLDWLKFFESSL